MTATVAIQLNSSGSGLTARLFQGSALPEALVPVELDLPEPSVLNTKQSVRTHGEALAKGLLKHRAIAATLANLSNSNGARTECLQFRIEHVLAERYRWETVLSEANDFLAVNPGCGVSRLAASAQPNELDTRLFDLPLRLIAYVSALGIDGQKEVEALVAAVLAAREGVPGRLDGLPIEADIHVGEGHLLDAFAKDPKKGVSFLPMPSTADALKAGLLSRRPQFVHFFCHGIARAGVLALEMATASDFDTAAAGAVVGGSVKLAIRELVDVLAAQRSSWVTVLNSCSGAASIERLNSMAFQIAERGSPLAVGMHEPLATEDAPVFSSIFYREAFGITGDALRRRRSGKAIELDLRPAIVPARQELHTMYMDDPPDAFGRWSLPVLFENARPLSAKAVFDDPETGIRVSTVADILASMGPTAPTSARDAILAVLDLDPAVPERYRPDRYGRFPMTEMVDHADP